MSFIRTLLLGLTLVFLAGSCKKDPDPVLSVTPATITLLSAGGSQELTITSNQA